MFNFFKRKKIVSKPLIIAIHGFGRKRSHEFDYFKTHFTALGYTVLTPDLFNQEDKTDNQGLVWAQRAFDFTEKQLNEGNEIYLVGFSMGGVIASYIASKLKIKNCVLIAPAFEIINTRNAMSVVNKVASKLINNEKELEPIIDEFIDLPDSYYSALFEVVNTYRKCIEEVPCPLLIIHGTGDNTISYRSSKTIYKKINHDKKQLLLLEGAPHRILEDEHVQELTVQIINLFYENKLFTPNLEQEKKD